MIKNNSQHSLPDLNTPETINLPAVTGNSATGGGFETSTRSSELSDLSNVTVKVAQSQKVRIPSQLADPSVVAFVASTRGSLSFPCRCEHDFDDFVCSSCEELAVRFSLSHPFGDCVCCAVWRDAFPSSVVAVTEDESFEDQQVLPHYPHTMVRFEAALRAANVLVSFREIRDFDPTGVTSEQIYEATLSELIESLTRPQRFPHPDLGRSQHDGLFFHAVCRFFEFPSVVARFFGLFRMSRKRAITELNLVHSYRPPKRRPAPPAALPWVAPRSARCESTPAPILRPQVFLSEWVSSTDFLDFGLFRVSSREELLLATSIFSRDRAIERSIHRDTHAPLTSWQHWLTQKLQDPKFAARVMAFFSDTRKDHYLQSGRLPTHAVMLQSGRVPASYTSGSSSSSSGRVYSSGFQAYEPEPDREESSVAGHSSFEEDFFDEKTGLAIGVVRDITRLTAAAHLLCTVESTSQKLSTLLLYCTSLPLGSSRLLFEAFAVKAMEVFAGGELQASSPVGDVTQSFLGILGVAHLAATFGEKVADFLNIPGLRFLLRRFHHLSMRADGDDRVSKFVASLRSLAEALVECFKARSIDPLFPKGESSSEVLFAAEALCTYQHALTALRKDDKHETIAKLIAEGKIPASWTSPFVGGEFMDKARALEARLDELIPLVQISAQPTLRVARQRLHLLIATSVTAADAQSTRVKPLGIAFVGETMVGKSMLMEMTSSFVARAEGIPYDSTSVYSWRPDQNFQDGLTPSHWCILADDLDHNCDKTQAGVGNHVKTVMYVVDNKPAPIESAAVEQKGTNFARPLLFLYGSNMPDLRLVGFSPDPAAVRRRLPILAHVFPAEGFRSGKCLDSEKARGFVDVHRIAVSRFDHHTGDYKHLKDMTTTEFLIYAQAQFRRNLQDQTSMRASGLHSFCSVCHLPFDKFPGLCPRCPPTPGAVLQGGRISCPRRVQRVFSFPGELAEEVSDLVVESRQLVRSVQERGLLDKVERVTDRFERIAGGVDTVTGAPARFRASLQSGAQSLGDLFVDGSARFAPPLLAFIAALTFWSVLQGSLQGRSNNSVDVPPPNFVPMDTVKPVGQAFRETTWTLDEVVTACRNAGGVVVVDGDFTRALRVGLDLFLVNHHIVRNGTSGFLDFAGVRYAFPINAETVLQFGKADVALLRVPGVPVGPTVLKFLWVDVDASYTGFDSVFLVRPEGVVEGRRNALSRDSISGYVGVCLNSDFETDSGDCGFPVIAVSNGRPRVIAIHHSRVPSFTVRGFAYSTNAPVVSQTMVRLLATRMGGSLQCGVWVESCYPNGRVFGPLPPPTQSELACALSRGAPVLSHGHLVNHHGSSATKSKCVRSPFYSLVEPFAARFLGIPDAYQVPIMKGAMREGVWLSGYQNIFPNYTPTVSYRELRAPVLDFLEPFALLDTSGYLALSEDEAFLGVEGARISSVNFSTSAGPPFDRPKKTLVSQAGFIHPDVRRQIQEVLDVVRRGDCPIVPVKCTLKDEPVKAEKNVRRDIRVFCTCPMAWNVVQKMYLAPIKDFLRNNPFQTESMVGIDMAGVGGSQIVERFRLVDPMLVNIVEGDYKKMDKTINGAMAASVVEVFGAIAELLGIERLVVESLVWSNFNVAYSIQGDIFQVGGMNPSGSDITVEINAIVNALAHRSAWLAELGLYLEPGSSELPPEWPRFRDANVLVTYGDDFLLAHAGKRDLDGLFARFASLGLIVTDGQKLEKPVYRSIAEVSFLKRSFFIEGPFVFCGLAAGSLLRSLMIFRESSLSLVDHSGLVLEQVMREVFLNRSLDFEEWRGLLRSCAAVAGAGSGYLSLKTKQEYFADWENGVFTPWLVSSTLQSGRLPVDFPKQQQQQHNNMTSSVPARIMDATANAAVETAASVSLPNPGQDSVPNVANPYVGLSSSSGQGVSLSHATGDVVTITDPVEAGSIGVSQFSQPMADARFENFFHRNTLLVTIPTFTTPMAATSFRPWNLWASDTLVAEKLANFNTIRGGLELTGVLNAPAMARGLVIVTAMPSYELAASYDIPATHSLVGESILLDLSTSSSFKMTLPWVAPSNWGNLTDDLYEGQWNVTVRVMSPLVSGIPDGCAKATLRIFARPASDFQLSGAHLQSGRFSSTSGAKSSPARVPASVQTRDPSRSQILDDASDSLVAKTGYKASEWLKAGAAVAAMATTIPAISPYAAGAAMFLGGASKVLAYFGYTRDAKDAVPVEALVRPAQNLINADGMDISRKASLFQHNAISSNPNVSTSMTGVDETSFSYIGGKYTYITTFEYVVGATDSADKLIPITPFLGAETDGGATLTPTTSGYLGARFTFWRGDMKYLFVPVVSAVNRGSLQFIYQPVPTSATIPDDFTNASINSIVDVMSAQPIEVVVGYNNDEPMCVADFYTISTGFTPADYMNLNGYLRVRSLIPFTGNDCGETIQVLVFAAACDNMQFAGPTDLVSFEGTLFTMGDDFYPVPVLQSGRVGEGGTIGAAGQSVLRVTLVPETGFYPVTENLAGEVPLGVRAMCEKPSGCYNLDGFIVAAPSPSNPTGAIIDSHSPDSQFMWNNWFRYYGTQFLGFAGSVRWKAMIVRESVEQTGFTGYEIQAIPMISDSTSIWGANPLAEINPVVTDLTLATEVQVPYYWNELYVPAYKGSNRTDGIHWAAAGFDEVALVGYLSKSAGPDSRYVWYRGQHKFAFRTPVRLNSYWLTSFVVTSGGGPPPALRAAGEEPEVLEGDSKSVPLSLRARVGRDRYKDESLKTITRGRPQAAFNN